MDHRKDRKKRKATAATPKTQPQANRTQSKTKRFSNRTASIVLFGVFVLAAVAGLTVRWLKQVEAPDEIDIDPAVAQIERDPGVAPAMKKIEAQVASKSSESWRKEGTRLNENWIDTDIQWLVIHQLKAFGRSPQRINFALRGVTFDERGRPVVRKGWEGHIGQLPIALLRAGVGIDEVLEKDSRQFSVRDMLVSLKERCDHVSIGKEDPGYLIEGFSYLVRPAERWTSDNGRETSLMHFVTLGFRRLPERGIPGTFACGGLHFGYGCGVALHAAEKREDLTDVDREHVKTLRLVVRSIRQDWLQEVIPEYVKLAKSSVAAFRRDPKELHAFEIRSAFTGLGHILELALDPNSAFYETMPKQLIAEAVQALAGLTEEWFSDNNVDLRDRVGKFKLPGGTLQLGQIIQGDLCHGYRALLSWSRDQGKHPPR